MQVHHGIAGLRQIPPGSALSIGNFDGVHRGHREILELLRRLRPTGPTAVATFEPHPLTALRPDAVPPQLTPFPLKQELLDSAGVDHLVVLPPTSEVMNLSAEQFWRILRDDVRPEFLVEGESFGFGKGRAGSITQLKLWAQESAVQIRVATPLRVALLDLQIVTVSSSLIRWLLLHGRARDAAICLGSAFLLQGRVVRGFQRGKDLGVPTANLDCGAQLIPGDGVYVGRCEVDGIAYPAAISIGTMATFGSNQRQVEVHLLGFSGDLYGRVLRVEMKDWIRDQRRFSDVVALEEGDRIGSKPNARSLAHRRQHSHWKIVFMNESLHSVLDRLRRCRRVLVTTHVRPDGDAIGASAAMVLALRAKQIDSHVLLLSELPAKYEFVLQESDVPCSIGLASVDLDSFDALLVVDTGTWSQLPGLADRTKSWAGPKVVIDHHLTQENWADAKWVDTSAAAAGEMVAELLQAWDVPITPLIASALFVAIASDTGWFQFSNTRPRTLRLAANLMEAGLDTDRLYQLLYQNERAVRLLLQTRALNSLELLADGRLAVMRLQNADFLQTAADMADTENLINIPLQIRAVQVSLFFVEPTDGSPIRVSLRSKGQVDVARFAERFGGGGHARAAGLKIAGTLHDVHNKVVSEMIAAI